MIDDGATVTLLVNASGTITTIAPADAQLGYNPIGHLLGRPLRDAFEPEDAAAIERLLAAPEGAEGFTPQLNLVRPTGGSPFHVWAMAAPCLSEGGGPEQVMVILGDGPLGRTAETPPFMLWCSDPVEYTSAMDMTSHRSYGLPANMTLDYAGFIDRVHPDDLTVIRGLELLSAEGTERSYQTHLRFRGDDGLWRWLLIRAAAVQLGDRPIITGVSLPLTRQPSADTGDDHEIERVYRTTETLIRSSSRDEVVDQLINVFPRLLGATQSTVAVGDGRALNLFRAPEPPPEARAPRRIPIDASFPTAIVAKTAKERFVTRAEYESLVAEGAPLVATPETQSWLILPLHDGADRLGAWALGFAASQRPATGTEAAIREVARMAAQALMRTGVTQPYLDFAEAFRAEVAVAEPVALRGVQSAVRSLPAQDTVGAGGDWYDVFPIRGDCVALIVGDVQGHGADVAPMMARIRTLLRAYALVESDPGQVLANVNDFLERFPVPVHATCVIAFLNTATGTLLSARAAHPPLVLACPEGTVMVEQVAEVEETLPLGMMPDQTFVTSRRFVHVGGIIALSTDGLLEGPSLDLDEGVAFLAEHLRGKTDVSLEELADDLFTQAARTGHRDDATLLLVRRAGAAEDRIVSDDE